MREIRQYSALEITKLIPVKDYLRQIRNDLMQKHYLRTPAKKESDFIEKNEYLRDKNIISIIAFEQPVVLDWLLTLSKKNLTEFEVLVFDNSLNQKIRKEIEQVCLAHDISYLSLPSNKTRHVNRSHSLAMSWVYHRIIRKISPCYFGFVDHDMLPAAQVEIVNRLKDRICHGSPNIGRDCWNLWAGYCFFEFKKIKDLPLNFLYDFPRKLDTGGRNWEVLYKSVDKSTVHFAPRVMKSMRSPDGEEIRTVQVVDNKWIHIGSISYNNNFDGKRIFFSSIYQALANGKSLADLFA